MKPDWKNRMPLNKRGNEKLIDWNEVRQRMSRAELAMEEAVHPTAEKAGQIMAERALKLSRPVQEFGNTGDQAEMLIFELGNERYALETVYVMEVFPLTDLTPVPGAPLFVAGVTHYRGEVLAIMDLRRLFGMEVRGMTDLSRIVVIGGEKAKCGILVDRAQEVALLSRESIVSQRTHLMGPEGKSILGVTRGALIVLDGEVLLNDARLIVRQDEEADTEV